MTTAIRSAIEQAQRLSPGELAELQTWINEHLAPPLPAADLPAPPRPARRPDFAADLQEIWGDAPPATENTVIALREEGRF